MHDKRATSAEIRASVQNLRRTSAGGLRDFLPEIGGQRGGEGNVEAEVARGRSFFRRNLQKGGRNDGLDNIIHTYIRILIDIYIYTCTRTYNRA